MILKGQRACGAALGGSVAVASPGRAMTGSGSFTVFNLSTLSPAHPQSGTLRHSLFSFPKDLTLEFYFELTGTSHGFDGVVWLTDWVFYGAGW